MNFSKWGQNIAEFSNPWLQLFLSQKLRGQFDPLHPYNGGPVKRKTSSKLRDFRIQSCQLKFELVYKQTLIKKMAR